MFPRFPLERPVRLDGPNGDSFVASSCDISAGGAGLLVSREAAVALAQGGSVLTTGDHVRLSLVAADAASAAAGLSLDCRVKHVRRLSQDQYLVGVWFSDQDPAQQAAVTALVEQARQAAAR
jgi:c-di-GMP-binding flagellar brake protein YcgR